MIRNSYLIIKIGSKRIEISYADRWFLILYYGRFFAALNNSCKSAGTLVLWIQVK